MLKTKRYRHMLKQLTRFLLLCFLLAGLAACSTSPENKTASADGKPPIKVSPQANAAYERALGALKSGREQEAEQLLTQVTKQYPQLSGGFTNLGLLYLREKKFPQAASALRQATTVNPKNAVGFNHLGVALRHEGKFEESKQAYLEALRLKSDYALAHLNLGILFDIYLQDLPQALIHYQRYKELNGEDKLVDKWIIDLQRRVDSANKKTQKEG